MDNGVNVKVECNGTMRFIFISKHVLNLSDTIFIPYIRMNLISISVLDKCGYTFHFRNGKIIIFYGSVVVGSAILYDDLYTIE